MTASLPEVSVAEQLAASIVALDPAGVPKAVREKCTDLLVDPVHRALRQDESGRLADIAPTILELLGLPQPPEMTGKSLLSS
jgi:2,3-bisphosphoglycerate-independent phosphoglycerate mutase